MTAECNPVDEPTIECLRELMEEDFDKLVENYLEDSEKMLVTLNTAIQEGDAETMKNEAHSLKSSCGNMGAFQMAEYAQQMEKLGFSGTIGNAPTLIEAAKKEFVRVKNALSAQLA